MTPKFKSIPQHECQQENNHIFNVKTGKVLKLLKKICLNVKTYSTTFYVILQWDDEDTCCVST
jgi:hypothetical protein